MIRMGLTESSTKSSDTGGAAAGISCEIEFFATALIDLPSSFSCEQRVNNSFAFDVHGELLSLRELFFLGRTRSLVRAARDLSAETAARSNRCPRNFNSSSLERNRISVHESTSGFVSGPSWTTNAPRMV
jgi:hypothetical protein